MFFLKQAANRFISAAKLGILTTALIEIVSLLEPASSCHSRNVFCYFCTGFNSQNSRCKTLRRGSLMPCWVWVVVLPQSSVLELQQRRKMLTIFLPLPPFLPVFLSFCSTGSNILRNSPTLNVFFFHHEGVWCDVRDGGSFNLAEIKVEMNLQMSSAGLPQIHPWKEQNLGTTAHCSLVFGRGRLSRFKLYCLLCTGVK